MTMRDWLAEIEVDEAQARAQELAERLRADGMAESGNVTAWLVVLCVIGLAVALALLILAGRMRRARAYDEEMALSGFGAESGYGMESGYGADEAPQYGARGYDDLDEVRIEERPAMPWQKQKPAAPEAVAQEPPQENVVPIRAVGVSGPVEPEPESEPDAMPARYAFAGGTGAAARDPLSAPLPAYVPPASQPPRSTQPPVPPRQESRMSQSYDDKRSYGDGSGRDDDQPFIAPFIREDIERAERRQADRIETLRGEVSRQLRAMNAENASRLDLFVSTVDRKLDGLDRMGGGVGEHDLQRVTEGSVRPVFERLERLTTQVAAQERRLADLAELMERRLGDVAGMRDDLSETSALVTSLAGRAIDAQGRLDALADMARGQSGLASGMDGLREGMARLERAILDRASEDGSASVALSEVVRGTLAEGSYAFSQRLPNGETADCVIRFEGHEEGIAIDAGFPMEAFDQLPSRDAVRRNLPQAKAGEDTFRRAILRAILQAADRCIVPGETTDSCLLFLPSEAAYTILHDRFGDLVRDAQRARVWLTSPSTLMGTLNLLSNLMGTAPALREDDEADEAEEREAAETARRAREEAERAKADRVKAEADKREAERRAMRDEIKALRERAAGLAGELDRTRGTLSELIDTTERLSGAEDDYRAPSWAEDDREDRHED